MRATHLIATQIEGTVEELLLVDLGLAPAPPAPPTIEDISKVIGDLCFMVETVAHLQRQEKTMLPTAEAGRRLIEALKPKELIAG